MLSFKLNSENNDNNNDNNNEKNIIKVTIIKMFTDLKVLRVKNY